MVPLHFGREQSNTRLLSAPTDAFDPWLLEGPPCGSPLSTSSSNSHPESVSTPPYSGLPIYSAVEQPFQHVRDTSTSNTSWTSEPEPMWRISYTESHPWSVHQYVLPCHSGPIYEQLPLQPAQSYLPPVGASSAPPFLAFNEAPSPYFRGRARDSAPFPQEEANNSDGSESDSDDSDCDNDSSQKSSQSTFKGSRANASVLKLGPSMDPFSSTLEQRHYHCGLIDANGRHPCIKKFSRPEHLRRHVKTVHGREQPYACKVPDCDKAFSRGDNLRDHYWTHLSRGCRAGKNRKMDFLELKAILGPKQRRLARRLRMKLNKQREKQMKSKI
jgi:hypothetical protein